MASGGILHHNGAYNIWGTIMDAPLYESALTLEQLTDLVRFEQGENGVNDLPGRLARAHVTGTSYVGYTLDEIITGNRAGENEAELPREEFITRYLTLPE